MDWTCNIGESAIDIVIFSSSNAPLSIFVLGEAYEVCITINSKGIGSRILLMNSYDLKVFQATIIYHLSSLICYFNATQH